MIIGDVIDLFLKKSKILYYNAYFIFNGKRIKYSTDLTVEELGIGEASEITCVDEANVR